MRSPFSVLGLAVGLAVALCVGPAGAQQPAPSTAPAPAATPVQGVTVTAPRQEAVANFVAQISTPPDRFHKQLPRWDGTEKHAQYMNDRLAANAIAVGLKFGQPGCKPNVLILVAPDADAFVAEIVKTHPDAFAKFGDSEGVATRGRKALQQFVLTPRPVRWWHISQTVTPDGQRIGDAVGGSDNTTPRSVRVYGASRIRPNTKLVFAGVIIVVDAKRAGGVSYQALCDYISMIALAQIDPGVESTSVPSILNLFHDRDAGLVPPTTLSASDVRYLEALYTVRPDARDDKHQRDEITDEMKKAARKPEK
jgi:hypothetical protein